MSDIPNNQNKIRKTQFINRKKTHLVKYDQHFDSSFNEHSFYCS